MLVSDIKLVHINETHSSSFFLAFSSPGNIGVSELQQTNPVELVSIVTHTL